MGLAINSSTGLISGTPPTGTAATYQLTVTVKDSSVPQQSASAALQLTIDPPNPNFLTISGGTVGQNLQIPITVTLSTPTAGGIVQILSNNPAAIALAEHSGDTGTGSLSIVASAGTTVFSVFAQGLASSGSATLTVSSTGYASGQSTVTAAPSAFVLAGPNGIGGSFITGENVITQLDVMSVQLDGSGNVAQAQPLAGGQTAVVNLTVADPNLGTVSPAAITFTSGLSDIATQFTAGSSMVNSSITANEPAGFSTPSGSANNLAVSVTDLTLSCAGVKVGQNLENFTNCSLSGAVQADTDITLSTSDATKLLLSTDPTVAGSPTIVRTIRAGGSATAPFYVYGLGNSGTVTFSASGGGFSATGIVTLAKSGFVLVTPGGLGSNFTATAGGSPIDVIVQTGVLDAGGNYQDTQALAGGLTASVTVTSSNTGVGTITGSPAVITGANNSAIVDFQPLAGGTSTLTAVTPAGYTTPAQFATVSVTVGQPRLIIDGGNPIGKNLQRSGTIILVGATAPTNGLVVHLTVTAGSASLSTTGTDAGFNSIDVTIPSGSSSGTYFMYGLAATGSATFSATAPGFTSASGTETLTPSGIVVYGPQGVGLTTFNTPLASGNQTLSVSTAQLDAGGNFVQTQALAGTAALTVSLTNTDATVGTVPATVAITPGTDTSSVTFHPIKVGTAIIGVVQPGGYTAPTDGTASLKINVQ